MNAMALIGTAIILISAVRGAASGMGVIPGRGNSMLWQTDVAKPGVPWVNDI
jgi:hypothetical protein